MKQVTTKIS